MLKFKNFAGIIGAGIMAVGLFGAVPAMAAETNASTPNPGTDTTLVQYDVADTDFTWGVPAVQTFTDEKVSYTGQLVKIDPASPATKILLPAGATVSVKVNSANGYELWTMSGAENAGTRVGTSAIDYSVYKDNDASNAFSADDVVLVYTAGTSDRAGISQGLTFATTAEKIAAATAGGMHTDKLTFTMTAQGLS